jgi:hypothetical protein
VGEIQKFKKVDNIFVRKKSKRFPVELKCKLRNKHSTNEKTAYYEAYQICDSP